MNNEINLPVAKAVSAVTAAAATVWGGAVMLGWIELARAFLQ